MRQFLRTSFGISLLATLLLAMMAAGEPLAHTYWNVFYKNVRRPAPASAVLLTIDDQKNLTSSRLTEILARLRLQMPRRVLIDTALPVGESAADDARLAREVRSYGSDIAFIARSDKIDNFGKDAIVLPPRQITGKAEVLVSAWRGNFVLYAVSAPYTVEIDGQKYSTVSAALAGVRSGFEGDYYPDFRVDPATIPRLASSELVAGATGASNLTGRTVIVTGLSKSPSVLYFGHSYTPAIALDIAGAEGLKAPFSLSFGPRLGSLPILALVALLVWFGRRSQGWRKAAAYIAALASVALVPAALRTQGIVFAPDTAFIFIGIYGTIRLWQKRAQRIQLTSASGLPNLLALGSKAIPVGSDVVVAVVARYEEILATLPRELHGECARQIARRIAAGSGADTIYHGDGGHFAWAEEARPLEMQLDHLEGLRALFSAPLLIGSHTFDTNIHFGLDRNEGLDSPTRVNSALASANEALSNGRAIELFEASRLAEAPWELSLHARIEEGLRNGDIWLAFQPQWNLKESRMCGAEALIRWNHPTRGPIAPDAFILQAERAGRIDALTYWVLDLAITAALALNARGPRFQMSINLSAQMVDKPDLVANFSDAVRRRDIDPSLLTIEITETSSVRNRPAACQNLTRLRELGFRLSIDDFGTGEASLAYLADLPSDELKIDRRFIDRLGTSPRDQAIVANTITLAHALGQTVVAEGIERPETLAILQSMGCDFAQGYLLCRPVAYSDLEKTYTASLSKAAGQV